MVARSSVCSCGGTAFYVDDGRGEVCRTCGRDGHRREPTDFERANPHRVLNLAQDAHLLKECANPPKETDCPQCLYPAPAHNPFCIYGDRPNGK